MLVLFLLLSAMLLSGCAGLTAVNLITPTAHVIAQDVGFSSDPNLRLDVYGPDDAATVGQRTRPIVIFLYGGGWKSGSREQYAFVASGLTSEGYLTVVPDMRKYPEVTFPDFANDAAAAVRWTVENGPRYGGDPQRIFLLGHSSGAHVAALLNYDQSYLSELSTWRVCGFIGLSGPYDFLPLVSPTLQAIFPESLRAASQPVNFVDGDDPPALLLHGLKDKTVKPRNSAALAEQVRQVGGEAEMLVYDDESHAQLVLALSSTLDHLAPVLDDVSEFVNAQSCSKKGGKNE